MTTRPLAAAVLFVDDVSGLTAFYQALAGMTLAQHGADVIRVDLPGGGIDHARLPRMPVPKIPTPRRHRSAGRHSSVRACC